MNLNVLVLPGDGIGTEVTGEAVRVLRVVAQKWGHQLTIREGLLGGIAIHKTGTPLPDDTLNKALAADATLRPQAGTAHLRPPHLRPRTDVARPFDPTESLDDGVPIDQHRSARRVDQNQRLHAGRRMDEAALREVPKIAKRTGYLALLANLAMLSGLLGTVSGLIVSFGAVSGESVDPSQKARILAEGISEAMNCTAFGLIVAIIALVAFAVLNGKTQGLEDDINEASVQVLNLVVTNRQKVNMAGVGG